METSNHAYALLRRFEGLRLNAYQCQAGRWTIGYGHTDGVTRDMKVDRADAEELLDHDVWVTERGVARLFADTPLTQGQWDALVCFAFNVGTAALGASSLLRLLKNGAVAAAAQEFLKYTHVHVNGVAVESAGLRVRRLAEQSMFLSSSTQREPAA